VQPQAAVMPAIVGRNARLRAYSPDTTDAAARTRWEAGRGGLKGVQETTLDIANKGVPGVWEF
jgi:hypothetical protein